MQPPHFTLDPSSLLILELKVCNLWLGVLSFVITLSFNFAIFHQQYLNFTTSEIKILNRIYVNVCVRETETETENVCLCANLCAHHPCSFFGKPTVFGKSLLLYSYICDPSGTEALFILAALVNTWFSINQSVYSII